MEVVNELKLIQLKELLLRPLVKSFLTNGNKLFASCIIPQECSLSTVQYTVSGGEKKLHCKFSN